METLSPPVTAIVTILIGAGVLAVAFVDGGLWGEEARTSAAGARQAPFRTQSELLVGRYLENGDYRFGELLEDMRGYFGARAEEVILRETSHLLSDGSAAAMDRVYSLRGLVYRATGKRRIAERAFRRALRLNPGNEAARAFLSRSEVESVVKELGRERMRRIFDLDGEEKKKKPGDGASGIPEPLT
ncbi:MAG: hypothetical protein ACNS63_04130 [Candidatus Nitrospinota bacterium M3_3B_026]